MSKYLLYGDAIIENDNTMKDFAKSVYKQIPDYSMGKEEIMDIVNDILADDVSRTDINYENLMYKYRAELGNLLYEIENHGSDFPIINFFGEKARESFNYLIKEYIDIYYEELIK